MIYVYYITIITIITAQTFYTKYTVVWTFKNNMDTVTSRSYFKVLAPNLRLCCFAELTVQNVMIKMEDIQLVLLDSGYQALHS